MWNWLMRWWYGPCTEKCWGFPCDKWKSHISYCVSEPNPCVARDFGGTSIEWHYYCEVGGIQPVNGTRIIVTRPSGARSVYHQNRSNWPTFRSAPEPAIFHNWKEEGF